ncbi:MAG: hypothetical protein U0175_10745 [Caldilineaceae bacterium]
MNKQTLTTLTTLKVIIAAALIALAVYLPVLTSSSATAWLATTAHACQGTSGHC